MFRKNLQYYKFCAYGFLKNLIFFGPFIILFLRDTGINFFQIGVLYSTREIANIVTEIPSGIVADKFGRKSAIISSVIFYIISFTIFYLTSNFYLFIVAMVFFGLGESFRSGTHKAMILDYLERNNLSHEKTIFYGHTRSWSKIGSAISAIISGFLVFYSGEYKIIFLASTIPYIFLLGLLISYPNYLNRSLDISMKKKNTLIMSELFSFIKTSGFRRTILNSALFDGLFKTLKDYLQPILQNLTISIPVFLFLENAQRSTIIITLVYFLLFIASSIASRHSYLFLRQFISISQAINKSYITGFVVIITCGVCYYYNFLTISVLLFILLFILQNIRRPMNVTILSDNVPSKAMATGISIESQCKTITVAILSPLIGYFADHFGIGIAVFSGGIILLILYPISKIK